MSSTELAQVTGSIEKILYKDGDSGFSVISVKVSTSESIMATGALIDVFQGETITLHGAWTVHPKFGRQFTIKDYSTKTPCTKSGIEKYLASGLIKGIGPKFAEKLVARFGEKTLEVIDTNPELLGTVPGVGPKKVEAIRQAWVDQKEISNVMVFLRSKDVSTAFAVKIFKTYGNQAVNIISRNPYRLIDDVWGVGFKSADQIALKLGLEPNSPQRVKAGFIHAINEATNFGHLYLDLESAKKQTIELLALDQTVDTTPLLKQALTELYSDDKIKLLSHDEKHFITLPHCYNAERGIAKKIKTLAATPASSFLEIDLQKIYGKLRLPDSRGIELNEEQQRGIMACFQNKITIITGGPGTGKTTLVKKLLELLDECNVSIRLAAPTGRAAKRMFEGTGRSTETIHRLLGFAPGMSGFTHNEQNALSLDYLILDEASMIDVFLMHSLLKAMPQRGHLILLGDVDQLPSVGAGNVLCDLIDSGVCAVTRLAHIFRQAQDSMIIVNAHRVNRGEFPTTSIPEAKNDFIYIRNDDPEELMGTLHSLYKKRLPMLGIKLDDAIVLSPMNRGTAGNVRINQELQEILNPAKAGGVEIQRFGQLYRENDRVMQIRNNYEKFIFNGDIGSIKAIDASDHKVTITFGERDLEYEFTELNEITLAYAISIHKSQGSEFGAVIIPIFTQHFVLLQRNLIYTAITRAKRLCILVGQSRAIAMAIGNNKSLKRNTFLKEFLTTNLEAR